jgi:poly(hydroxyalkanoate) depolymerase family esterase
LKADKSFVEAMRQATQLVRTQGPIAATRFIQRLLRPNHVPVTPVETRVETPVVTPVDAPVMVPGDTRLSAEEGHADVVVEVLDPVGARATPLPAIDTEPVELPPASGQFLTKRFSASVGSRDYKLYLPSGYADVPLPLVVMLHGCTQDPDDFALGTRANRWAESRRLIVVYPQQIRRANAHRCWNWFRPVDQDRGRGEPAIIAGITQQVIDEFHVDAQRVYVVGMSAGGAMAAVVGRAYPEMFAAIGIHSGLPAGVAQDVPSALALMKAGHTPLATNAPYVAMGPYLIQRTDSASNLTERATPLIVLQGDADRTVNPANADRLVQAALDAYRLNGNSPLQSSVQTIAPTQGSYGYRRTQHVALNGARMIEQWDIHGAGHAWSGGNAAGSHTDAHGPDATKVMLDFFEQHVVPDQRDTVTIDLPAAA